MRFSCLRSMQQMSEDEHGLESVVVQGFTKKACNPCKKKAFSCEVLRLHSLKGSSTHLRGYKKYAFNGQWKDMPLSLLCYRIEDRDNLIR